MVDCVGVGGADSVLEDGSLLRTAEDNELVEGVSVSIIGGVGGVAVSMGLSKGGIIVGQLEMYGLGEGVVGGMCNGCKNGNCCSTNCT